MPDEPDDPRPRSRLTVRVRRDVLVDAAAYRLVASRASRVDPTLLARIDGEVTEALDLFEQRGWVHSPETYHRDPPPPEGVRTRRGRSGNLRFTTMSWLDGFEPRRQEPGVERFLSYRANRVARATLLEHRSADRPWLICLHGFGMGSPSLDLRAFRALRLHRDLGLNLAFLTLPFHGRRNPGPSALAPMPSADVLDTVHGLTQAVWDVRQLFAHLRARTGQPIGLMGLSLGGLVAATVGSIDEPHAVLLLVPAVDLPGLAADATRPQPEATPESDLLVRAGPLFAPVSPLQLTPNVSTERRFIVSGTLDRFARPSSQAVALWRHWGNPPLHWYHGGHVSMFWARGVQGAIDAHLRTAGLA
ncbi:MAG TPA: hypothetical protein VJM33_15220 [Microthrixaceae bacterium]|nr:hypothetical protein [Microthrixaceae bacterium]